MSQACPECQSQKVTSRPHRLAFDYQDRDREGLVSLEADVQSFQCEDCSFGYLDHTAETAKNEAVRQYLTASERIAFRPVVWVPAKNAFYSCADVDFKASFRALCSWSTSAPDGPAWTTPVLHEGMWHVSARHALNIKQNIVARAMSPEGATVALAVTLGLQ